MYSMQVRSRHTGDLYTATEHSRGRWMLVNGQHSFYLSSDQLAELYIRV